jgi:hypothetical protein
MAGAVAEAGAAEKAAETLTYHAKRRSRECDDAPAGCSHARKRLPRGEFAL